MAKLSREAIRTLAARQGFRGKELDVMTAIAFAESGGDPNAHVKDNDDDSYGLWQINMIGAMGLARRTQFGISRDSQLLDPDTNAKAAHIIYQSQGLKAWATYTSGAYKQFMNGVTVEDGEDLHNSSNLDDKIAEINPLNNVANSISALGKTLFSGVSNIGGIIVAIVFVILGVVILSRGILPAGKVAKKVAKVIQ